MAAINGSELRRSRFCSVWRSAGYIARCRSERTIDYVQRITPPWSVRACHPGTTARGTGDTPKSRLNPIDPGCLSRFRTSQLRAMVILTQHRGPKMKWNRVPTRFSGRIIRPLISSWHPPAAVRRAGVIYEHTTSAWGGNDAWDEDTRSYGAFDWLIVLITGDFPGLYGGNVVVRLL